MAIGEQALQEEKELLNYKKKKENIIEIQLEAWHDRNGIHQMAKMYT